MLLGDLERLVDALLDRDGRHDDHESGEAETLVQLEDRAEVNVGLARPRLHFDGAVAGRERRRRRQTVAELHILQDSNDLNVETAKPVADTHYVFDTGKLLMNADRRSENRREGE